VCCIDRGLKRSDREATRTVAKIWSEYFAQL
jgi:hypothetical protein